MRKLLLLPFLIISFTLTLLSQNTTAQSLTERYKLAVESFESQDYLETFRRLTLVTPYIDDLSKSKRTYTRYMEGKSIAVLLRTGNDSIVGNKYGIHPALTGYNLINEAKNSAFITLKPKINADIPLYYSSLFKEAQEAIDNGLVGYANIYYSACHSILPESYLDNYLLSLVCQLKRDTANCKEELVKAIHKAENVNDKESVLYQSQMHYSLSRIELYHNGKAELAYDEINKAMELLDISRKDPPELLPGENPYIDLNKQYKAFELNILIEIPEKEDKAIDMFEIAVSNEPANYSLHIAYAQLLSRHNFSKAVEVYDKAIFINPQTYITYYNLGTLYLNEALKNYELSQSETDSTKSREYFFNYQEYYGQAYLWLEKAHERNKEDLNTLYALRRIAAGLYYMDDYEYYNMLIDKIEYQKSIRG